MSEGVGGEVGGVVGDRTFRLIGASGEQCMEGSSSRPKVRKVVSR